MNGHVGVDVFWDEDPLPLSADATLVPFPQMRPKESPRPYDEGEVPILALREFIGRPMRDRFGRPHVRRKGHE